MYLLLIDNGGFRACGRRNEGGTFVRAKVPKARWGVSMRPRPLATPQTPEGFPFGMPRHLAMFKRPCHPGSPGLPRAAGVQGQSPLAGFWALLGGPKVPPRRVLPPGAGRGIRSPHRVLRAFTPLAFPANLCYNPLYRNQSGCKGKKLSNFSQKSENSS